MSDYRRVVPRDLFNESNLLLCYGRLVILLQETPDHRAAIDDEDVDFFDIQQDASSGALTIRNLPFTVGGVAYGLERPLNSRDKWPLWVETCDVDPDFEPVRVFDDAGDLSKEMRTLIG